MFRAILLATLIGAVAVEAEDKKPKIDPRFDESVTVRRFMPQNKEGEKYINPDKNIPAYRRPGKVAGETYFYMHYLLAGPREKSEIIDGDGNVWEVKSAGDAMSDFRHVDAKGNKTTITAMRAIVVLKKKAPDPKKP